MARQIPRLHSFGGSTCTENNCREELTVQTPKTTGETVDRGIRSEEILKVVGEADVCIFIVIKVTGIQQSVVQ